LDGIDGRLDGIDGRLDGIDGRLDGIDGRLDGIDERLDRMDARMDRIDARMDRIETGVAALREDTNKGFRMFGERLTRIETLVETLIERDAGEPGVSDTPGQPSP
jgi:archaellum component FlaC